MKKRSVIISVLALVAILVAGGTMAWFTSNPAEVNNQFTAGTVDLKFNEGTDFSPITNWNPGDETPKPVYLEYLGSKRALVRVKLEMEWLDEEGDPTDLSTDNVTLVHHEKWKDGGDGWLYWTWVVESGPIGIPALTELVKLDGSATGNDYQGKSLKITYTAQSVQASNGAYKDEWEIAELPVDILFEGGGKVE